MAAPEIGHHGKDRVVAVAQRRTRKVAFKLEKTFEVTRFTFFRQRRVPDQPGIYVIICRSMLDSGEKCVYVGQAKDLKRRYVEHFNERQNEVLRLLIESCDDLEFAWRRVYEVGALTTIEKECIARYKAWAINIQFI